MKQQFPREGIFAALAIPTDSRQRVIKSAVAKHLAWLSSKGVKGVLALGSTGEFCRFSVEQRKRILETIAELAGPMSVLANVSDIRAEASIELARFAEKLGLAGISIMPPSFYPVSQADQLAFFLKVADSTDLSVMLYNFPELTCNRIGIETVAAFADKARMGGIKQSGGEFAYHDELIKLGKKKGYVVFSGADTRLPEVFAKGAAGCIGGLVNFVPEYMVGIYDVCHRGKKGGDLKTWEARMKEVGKAVDRHTFPYNVAAGLIARGFEAGVPKTVVSDQSAKVFDSIVSELSEKFAAWGLEPAPASKRRAP